MTYKQLLVRLQELSEEQLGNDLTIYGSVKDEYFAITELCINQFDDVLDEGHPYFSY